MVIPDLLMLELAANHGPAPTTWYVRDALGRTAFLYRMPSPS